MKRVFLIGLISLLPLSACGGGSSSSNSALPSILGATSSNTNAFPIQQVLTNYLRVNNTYNISTSYLGRSLSECISITQQPQITVGNTKLDAATETVIAKADGTTIDQSSSTYLTDASTGRFYGLTVPGSKYKFVVTAGGAVPITAAVGDSGPYYSGNIIDHSADTIVGTEGATYQVVADPSSVNTALLCINTTSSAAAVNGNECFRIDKQGKVLGALVNIFYEGQTITLKNFLKQQS